MATFCQLFDKIGLLVIPTSGHTDGSIDCTSQLHNKICFEHIDF